MKTGMTLDVMARELMRQHETKRDFVASNAAIEMVPSIDKNVEPKLQLGNFGQYPLNDLAHMQLGGYTGIPKPYYDRMRAEDPTLLAENVNRWLHDTKPRVDDRGRRRKPIIEENRMVRTLDGKARAWLSEKYRPLENFDLGTAILPVLLGDKENVKIESCDLTETRMYIKATTKRLEADVKLNDPVQAGVVITNSEVGLGMIKIEPMLYRLRCLNGMISADASLRKYHVGRAAGGDVIDVAEFFRDETRQADDRAFFLKVIDVVKAVFNDDRLFNRLVNRMRETTEHRITADPVKVVELTAKRYGFNDTEQSNVLRKLIEGADLSQYGLLNAITAASQDKDLSYDRATELEHIGGEIIELSQTDWKALAVNSN